MAEKTSELFVGVNEPEDLENPSDLEKKHMPVIEAPDSVKVGECFEVKVEVGRLLEHPNEHNHFIQFINLYADDTFLARADFTAVATCPVATLNVALQHPAEELRVYERCNLHGTWVGRKPIKVNGG
jgi:superoxide reductase